jgi:P27 family predicted phage terminase small subunit
MSKGRTPDPGRARRGTGNRPAQGTPKVVKAAPVLAKIDEVEAYPPPAGLPEIVHPVWKAIVEDLGGANHMRDSYLPAITAYCEAVYLHAEASANIHEFGILVKGPSGPIANPLIRVQKDAAATMLRYADSLGLTPSGRIRLGLMEITGMSLLGSLKDSLDRKN